MIDAVFECEEIVHRPGERPSWRFRCPHCDEWHYHGAGEGGRVAHCPKRGSPYRRAGYYLIPKAPACEPERERST